MTLDPREVEQFLNHCRIKLTGASDAGIKVEFFDVLREFCTDSNAWREDIPFNVVGAPQPNSGDPFIFVNQDYPLASQDGSGGRIIRLAAVWDDKGIPVGAVMPVFGTVHLIHPVNTTPQNPWIARVIKNVVLPTTRDDMPQAPPWILGVYFEAMLDGVLGRMMSQQNKSYSNSSTGTYHLRRFRAAIASARTAAERQNLRGGQEWAYPRGWNSLTQRGGVSTPWPTRAF